MEEYPEGQCKTARILLRPQPAGRREILKRTRDQREAGARTQQASFVGKIKAREDGVNVYAARRHHGPVHDARRHRTGRRPIFLSCEKCNAVQEVDSEGIFDTIDRLSREASFQPRVKFVEVSGLCRNCQSKKD